MGKNFVTLRDYPFSFSPTTLLTSTKFDTCSVSEGGPRGRCHIRMAPVCAHHRSANDRVHIRRFSAQALAYPRRRSGAASWSSSADDATTFDRRRFAASIINEPASVPKKAALNDKRRHPVLRGPPFLSGVCLVGFPVFDIITPQVVFRRAVI